MRRIALPGAIFLAAMAGAAHADGVELDVVGEVNATIDGESTQRFVLSGTLGGEEGTTARLERIEMHGPVPDMWTLNVTGHDPESDDILRENVLVVSAPLGSGDDPESLFDQVDGPEVTWVKQNGFRPEVAYTSDGHPHENAEATIEHLELNGDTGHARGTAFATACRFDMTDMMAGVDGDDCVDIDVSFDTEFMLDEIDLDL